MPVFPGQHPRPSGDRPAVGHGAVAEDWRDRAPGGPGARPARRRGSPVRLRRTLAHVVPPARHARSRRPLNDRRAGRSRACQPGASAAGQLAGQRISADGTPAAARRPTGGARAGWHGEPSPGGLCPSRVRPIASRSRRPKACVRCPAGLAGPPNLGSWGLGHPLAIFTPLSAPAWPPGARSVPASGALGFAQGVGCSCEHRRRRWGRRRRVPTWHRHRSAPSGDIMFRSRREHTSKSGHQV